MRWNTTKLAGTAVLALSVAGCGGKPDRSERPESIRPISSAEMAGQDGQVVLGDPYTIDGKRFEPRDDVTHDEVGYAMVSGGFGPEAAGLMALAHRTLPVPSYVEVTNLETGKTILARIVARGPMLKDRIADLTPGAAQALGLGGAGAPVRVRRVNPPDAEKGALRSGRAAPARLDTPPALLSALRRRLHENDQAPVALSPRPDTAPAPVAAKPVVSKPVAAKPMRPSRRGADFSGSVDTAETAPSSATAPEAAPTGSFFVQLGSFSEKRRADALAARSGARVMASGGNYRVRIGPFGSREEAEGPLGQMKRKGYPQATIVR